VRPGMVRNETHKNKGKEGKTRGARFNSNTTAGIKNPRLAEHQPRRIQQLSELGLIPHLFKTRNGLDQAPSL